MCALPSQLPEQESLCYRRAMNALDQTYRYAAPSSLENTAGGARLSLATSAPGAAHPYFFEGRLRKPRLTAELLTAVHLIVGARFFTPANTLAKKIALADPIVTSGGGLLRFEGFSGCCSAYIRVDLLPEGYDGDVVGKGTTNVDFNAPMRAALARVRDTDALGFTVGRDEFRLRADSGEVIEKKVALPVRWARGLLEVQSYQASMRPRLQASGIEALRLFRSLPRASGGKTALWATRGPQGLYTTTRDSANGVRFTDTSRLRVLEPLLARALSLHVYSDDRQQACAWVLEFAGARLTLCLSAEVWRGFSGEGQALRALMQADNEAALAGLRAQLHWQSRLDVAALAQTLALDTTTVEDSLRVLGVSGLVGFDVFEGAYFHRVLPLDLSLVEDMHPRLAGARALLAEGAVSVTKASPLSAQVQSGGVAHHVREVDGELHCTCPWFAKYQGMRGPCKHVLAVEAFQAG